MRSHGGRIAEDAAQLLVQAVGQDLRAPGRRAHQLTSDFPDEPITEAVVQALLRRPGRGEVVRDRRRRDLRPHRAALEELRWALDSGTAPVLVTSAFASGLRGLAKFKSRSAGDARGRPGPRGRACRRGSSGRCASRPAAGTTAAWRRAISAVAQADADVKGAASDAAYALERMVLTVTARAAPDRRQTTRPTATSPATIATQRRRPPTGSGAS